MLHDDASYIKHKQGCWTFIYHNACLSFAHAQSTFNVEFSVHKQEIDSAKELSINKSRQLYGMKSRCGSLACPQRVCLLHFDLLLNYQSLVCTGRDLRLPLV